jgi:hypothetical protein
MGYLATPQPSRTDAGGFCCGRPSDRERHVLPSSRRRDLVAGLPACRARHRERDRPRAIPPRDRGARARYFTLTAAAGRRSPSPLVTAVAIAVAAPPAPRCRGTSWRGRRSAAGSPTDYAERGWHLNRGDATALDAIEAFCDGRLDEHTALATIRGAKGANALRARARGAVEVVTRRQKEVLRNVMRQHPSWYRAEGNGECVTLAGLFRAQLLERHAWRGQEGEPTRPTSTVPPHACWRC